MSQQSELSHATLLIEMGQFADARMVLAKLAAQNPATGQVHFLLGLALTQLGKIPQAIAAYRQSIELSPDRVEPRTNLAVLLSQSGQAAEAGTQMRAVVKMNPSSARARSNLGAMLREAGDRDAAIAEFEHALKLEPNYVEASSNLGSCYLERGKFEDALEASGHAAWVKPELADGHYTFAEALRCTGDIDRAVAEARTAHQLDPRSAKFHSTLIFNMHSQPGVSAVDILRECRAWAEQFEKPLIREHKPHDNDRAPDRPLRVGYVSADFCHHPIAFCLLPLLPCHSKNVEVFAYSCAREPDEITERFQKVIPNWRDVLRTSDEDLADLIRKDRIDILVDLSLQTFGNRLQVFARKSAPVQITWLGCPSTTGLSSIDYRLTDACFDPDVNIDLPYSEKSIQLPHGYLCWQPPDKYPDVNPLPEETRGHITFASLNNFAKVTQPTIRMWIDVMQTVRNARLIIKAPEGAHRARLLTEFTKAGVDKTRIEFLGNVDQDEYLGLFHNVDVCLDCTPYTGHTTTLDSLWMGAPVVTLRGQTGVGRGSASVLSQIGMQDFIAEEPAQYTSIAASISQDIPRLVELRKTLRQRLRDSSIMNYWQFAGDLEEIYRRVWLHRVTTQ